MLNETIVQCKNYFISRQVNYDDIHSLGLIWDYSHLNIDVQFKEKLYKIKVFVIQMEGFIKI